MAEIEQFTGRSATIFKFLLIFSDINCLFAGRSALERSCISGIEPRMAKPDKTNALSWPWWASWALLAVVVTSAMTIAAILQNKGADVVTVKVGSTVRDAVARLAEHRIGALPVCDSGEVAGIMSERDVIYALQSHGAEILDWPVERIMTAPAITVETDKQIMSALSLMTQRRIRHLPVVESGRIVGLVSIGDVVKAELDQYLGEVDTLQTQVGARP